MDRTLTKCLSPRSGYLPTLPMLYLQYEKCYVRDSENPCPMAWCGNPLNRLGEESLLRASTSKHARPNRIIGCSPSLPTSGALLSFFREPSSPNVTPAAHLKLASRPYYIVPEHDLDKGTAVYILTSSCPNWTLGLFSTNFTSHHPS